MAYALVGSVGAYGTTTPAWGTGSTQTANDLLIAIGWGSSGGTVTTPSGWSLAVSATSQATADSAFIFYTIAAGGDAAPTLTGASSSLLMEFSGNATTSPLDQTATGGNTGNSTSLTLTTGGTDAAAGELVLLVLGAISGKSTGAMVIGSQNNGLSLTITSTDAAAQVARGTTTGNSVADSVSAYITHSGVGTQAQNGVLASFKLSSGVTFTVIPISRGRWFFGSEAA